MSLGLVRLRVVAERMLVAFSIAFSAGPTRADSPPRVLIVDRGSEGLTRKVRAEALNAGFAVIDTRARAQGGTDSELLEQNRASALLRISSSEQVEIQVARSGESNPYAQTLTRRLNEGEAFPLRVVEQVRARLVELKLWVAEPPELPPQAAVAANAATESPAPVERSEPAALPGVAPPGADHVATGRARRRAPPRIWFNGGVLGLLPSGGLGATTHAHVGARFEPEPEWGFGFSAMLPLVERDVVEAEGKASVNASVFAAGLDHSLLRSQHWFTSLGVGAGVLVLNLRARATDPYLGREDRLIAGIGYLEASAGRNLGSWLRIKAGLLGGASAPRPVLRFDNREVPFWGRWFGGLSLRAELGLFTTAAEGG